MFSSPAFAQSAGGAAAAGSSLLTLAVPWILILGIFYVLMIRPQQTRMKQHRAALAAVKKGDVVVTGGGLLGKVTRVDEGEVEIELAANVRVKAVRATLTEVRPSGTAKPAND